MRIPRFFALLSVATLVLCAASFADSTFNLTANGTGDIGSTSTFTGTSPASLTLWGFSTQISGGPADTHLFVKTGGGDENGVGLVNDPSPGEDEIAGHSFIQFSGVDLTSITVGSVQSGESFQLWGSNVFGTLGTTIGLAGTADGSVALPAGFAFYSLTAPTGNVLLDSVSYSVPTPEPGTTAMILTLGLVGLFEVGRRKLMA